MKRGYLGVYVKMILIIAIIAAIITGVVYFMKKEYDAELFETVKTDMLLIEGKTKVVAEKVRIKEKGAKYIGKRVKKDSKDEVIKELQEKKVINLNKKNRKYYVLQKSHLEKLGLGTIDLKEGCYIVEYTSNEIIYTKGVEDSNGNRIYKLSDFK